MSMVWSYGVTTVPSRVNDLLPRTLDSLKLGGFPAPRLFIDGAPDLCEYIRFGLEATLHTVPLRTHGNWITCLYELYIREPNAARYAIFQDDVVTCKNLRTYLENVPFPGRGYWNLYTFPENQKRAPADGSVGWYESNQMGKGALALIFDREGALALLGSPLILSRPQDAGRGHKAIDGGVVDAMRKCGYKELVHNPSLVEHIGQVSSMGNGYWNMKSESFRGENFDATELIKEH